MHDFSKVNYHTCIDFKSKAMFVFQNLFFEKLFFKLFCVCLSLEKLVNEKYFPVKEKFDFVSRKVFS
jgi:hypothetical protein